MIARRTVKDDWWKVAAYTGILALNMIATVLAFPTFESNYAMIANLVPDFLSFLKRVLEEMGQGKFSVFAGINHFFKGANIIGPAAAIILSLGTVVRELETGTIGLLLSRPVSRTRILLGFIAVHLLELTLPLLLVTLFLPYCASALIDREIELTPFIFAAIHGCAFISMVYGISLLCAVLLNEQIKVAAVAGGICILSFMLYFIDATRPFTIYNLSSMEIYLKLVQGDPLPVREFTSCLVIGAGCLIAAIVVFRRRDY
ncbi:MAG: ABC transporter permease subunit [Planctomycetota bacterium]